MKNTLAFAALFAVLSTANAGSLNWSAMRIYEPGTTTGASDYVAYLFITEQNSNYGATTTTIQAVKDLIESGAEYYTEGDNKYLKKGDDKIQIAAVGATTGGKLTGATNYNGNNFGAGDSLKGFAVIFDATTQAGASNYLVTQEASTSWTSSTGAKSLGFGSQANATWTPVPEPSTAALALAGLALLLKRRRA